jgi:UBA/TS-N domain
MYLKLECIENLPDVIERLATAERVLRKQVNSNFVTLALVQAELGKPVPAVASIFVRLFLLQGVAYRVQENVANKGGERLDWAWALAKSLRSVSPPNVVSSLSEAVNATPYQAISALRRMEGNVNRAAEIISQEKVTTNQATEDRDKQGRIGLCENGADYVNLRLMEQLKDILQLSTAEGDDISSGLLRLANNNLEHALDIYQNFLRDPVSEMQRVEALDRTQGRSRKRIRRHRGTSIDQFALASLLSMGWDKAAAEIALHRTENNVAAAFAWLTKESEGNIAASPGDGGTVQAPATPALVSQPVDAPMVTPPGNENAEDEAVAFLTDALGKVLEENVCGDLGNSLDEEWCYIEKYRAP